MRSHPSASPSQPSGPWRRQPIHGSAGPAHCGRTPVRSTTAASAPTRSYSPAGVAREPKKSPHELVRPYRPDLVEQTDHHDPREPTGLDVVLSTHDERRRDLIPRVTSNPWDNSNFPHDVVINTPAVDADPRDPPELVIDPADTTSHRNTQQKAAEHKNENSGYAQNAFVSGERPCRFGESPCVVIYLLFIPPASRLISTRTGIHDAHHAISAVKCVSR